METETILLLAGVVLLLVCSAFFSGSETALMSSSKPKLHKKEKEGDKGAARVNRIISCPETLLSTILLGNNLVNIAASALTTGLFIKLFGDSGIAMATLVMTFVVLIFAEILPKTIASKEPEKHSMWISVPMSVLIPVLSPFTKAIRVIARALMKVLGINPDDDAAAFGEEDVKGAIGMGLEEGVLEKGEHRMLDSVFKLEELTVEDVMTHRSSLQSLSIDTDIEEIFNRMAQRPCHSRIPIWQDDLDNIVGILHVKDFIHAYHHANIEKKDLNIKDILQEAYFVPETAILSTQLLEFRNKARHMGLVVDEYGTLQGLVTLEDILEEIVGEIEDEHDEAAIEFVREEDGSITLQGTFPIRDANHEFDWALPEEEDAVTIAGLLTETAGGIPTVGEEIEIGNLVFKITNKKRQAIQTVQVTEKETEQDTNEDKDKDTSK